MLGYRWKHYCYGRLGDKSLTADSSEDEEALFPGGIVTNCTFGGQDLTTLYVTAGGCLYQAETSRRGA
ncbi:TPA: hypothetical protein EYN98_25850 [Candidatus Poribacteria bacterium]|nr:hypothetical protein [Candidatus Poribacteria bacterium]